MPNADARRDVLFLLLAMKQRAVDYDALAATVPSWPAYDELPLSKCLEACGVLSPRARLELERQVDLLRETVEDGHTMHETIAHHAASEKYREQSVAKDGTAGIGDGPTRSDRGGTKADVSHAPVDASQIASTIRFTRLREHARGGLGQVSVARDEGLQRNVALKELLPDRLGVDNACRRFVNEAVIMGSLEHPGIVPIYAMVEDEHGHPSYAMRFVEGKTLRQAINAFHAQGSPGQGRPKDTLRFRELLGHFVDACQAVAYAHSRGVIHRDLKPSNIMLGAFGETLIVDWGLAKRTDAPDAAADAQLLGFTDNGSPGLHDAQPASELTQAGQILGTLNYMAPEQARGEQELIGPGADIYALGAILFELTAGRLALDGSFPDVLEQVQQGKAPTLRSVMPTADRALDAICQTAMQPDPSQRYRSAAAMAEDIECWLADEPVSVLEEPLRKRIGRWMRRHRTLVTTSVVGLAVAAAGLGIATWQLDEKNQQLAVARDRAESRFHLAVNAIDGYRQAIDDNLDVKYRPELEGLRAALFAAPRDFYAALRDDLAESSGVGIEQQLRLADAYVELASIDRQVGSEDRAVQSLQAGLKIAEKLEAADQRNVEVRLLVGQIHSDLASQLTTGADTIVHLERARHRFEEILEREPDLMAAQRGLAIVEHNFGQALAREGKTDEAIDAVKNCLTRYRTASAIEPEDHLLGVKIAHASHTVAQLILKNRGEPQQTLEWLSSVLPEARELAEQHPEDIEAQRAHALLLGTQSDAYQMLEQHELALETLTASESIWEGLADRFPTYTRIRYDQAVGLGQTAQLYIRTGQPEKALSTLQSQRALLQQLVDTQPENLVYRAALERCMMVEGGQYYALGDKSRSLQCFQQLVPLCEETLRLDSSAVDRWVTLAGLYYNMGTIRSEIGDPELSLADYQRSLAIRERFASEQPDNPDLQNQLAFTLGNIGTLYLNALDNPEEAAAWIKRARDVQRRIVAEHPEVGRFVNSLARTLDNLATVYERLDAGEKAIAAYSEARLALEQLVSVNDTVTQYRRDLAMACWNQGISLRRQGGQQLADEATAQALEIWQTLAQQHPEEQINRISLCTLQAEHLQYLAERGRSAEALELAKVCMDELAGLSREAPDNVAVRQGLRHAFHGRAQARARSGELAGAREDFDQAAALLGEDFARQDGLLREALLAAWAGEVDRAELEMQRVASTPDLTPRQKYLLAKAFAVAATTLPDDSTRRQRLADACLEWLQAAAEQEYFAGALPQNDLRGLQSFDIVRDRAEFRRLLQRQE